MNVSLKSNHQIGIGSAVFSSAMYWSISGYAVSSAKSNWANIIVFLIVGSIFFFMLKKMSSFSFGIFENITMKSILLAFGCAILGYSLNYGMNLLILQKVFKSSYDSYQAGFQGLMPVSNLVYVCLLGPIAEELLVRRYILGGLRNRYGTIIALFASSALFAVSHLNIVQGINAFVMGIILGLLYLNTGSIFSCILVHVLNNSIAMFVIIYGLHFSI